MRWSGAGADPAWLGQVFDAVRAGDGYHVRYALADVRSSPRRRGSARSVRFKVLREVSLS